MVAARRTGGRRWCPRSSRPLFSPCVFRPAPAVPRLPHRACRPRVLRAGACCQNPLRLGNTFDATRPRASKVLPNRSENLARRARMRHGGPPGTDWDRFRIKDVAQSQGILARAASSGARMEPIAQSQGFSARAVPPRDVGLGEDSSAGHDVRRARRTGPRTSGGVVRGPGRGAVSEAASARPRRWRQWAGGRPGARRWREGSRPRAARRARSRSWSRS